MKKSLLFSLCAVMVISLASCSKKLEDRLPGTWTVSEIKSEPASGNGSATTSTNVGTMKFEANNTGDYSLNILGNTVNGDFSWVAADNNATVTLSGFWVGGAYTVITNKNNTQVWQRLDTNGDKYTYTLDR